MFVRAASLALTLLAPVLVRSIDVPTSPFCDEACAEAFRTGYEFDYNNWVSKNLSTDAFWDTPSATNDSVAGQLIRWQDVTPTAESMNWTIPGGMTLGRFLYWTEDVDGSLLPASAFALLPYRPPQGQDKLRTILWAHGTAGHSPMCGPSNHRNLYYDWSAPYSMAQAGYAVIGPDYTGLGTTIPQGFMYLAGKSHAADMAFALIAAREKLGGLLSHEWVAAGQSEGGMTAWRTNERLAMEGQEALLKAGTFLGAVSIAPALRGMDMIDALIDSGDITFSAGVALYTMQSLQGLYPDTFHLEDFLTPTALGRVELADKSCVYGGNFLYAKLNLTETYINSSWTSHPAAIDWRTRYAQQGNFPLAAPMLVVQGDADDLVPVNFTREDYQRTCALHPNSSLQLNIYSGQDHDVVTTAAQADYMPWIADRFDKVPATEGCSQFDFGPSFEGFNRIANVYMANL